MFYICEECGEVFEDSEIFEVKSLDYGNEDVSPCCHSGYTKAVFCPECHEWVAELDEDMLDIHVRMCKQCRKEAVLELEHAVVLANVSSRAREVFKGYLATEQKAV